MEKSKEPIGQYLLYLQLGNNAMKVTQNICRAKGPGTVS